MSETVTSPLAMLLPDLRQRRILTPAIERAFRLAEELYVDEMHWMGMSQLEHSAAVLKTLLPFEPDEEAIITSVLHQVLETKKITLPELEEQFGASVRSLTSGVHLLAQVQLQTSRNSIQNLRLMLLSVTDDLRVILIILCDRVSLMDELSRVTIKDQKWLCQNALHLFAPVASRLGIHSLKQRLENAAFPVLYPNDSALIQHQFNHVHEHFGDFMPEAAARVRFFLAEQGITPEVDGREKQMYSVFMKMKSKSLSQIERLHDLFALRIVVETEEDCYRVLGMLHRIGRPAANRFKDYIAFPKPNGYRSLHTTMARFPGVPEGLFLEVQIRTRSMHREAEYGIAAHWSYKERGSAARVIDRVHLQEVLAKQQSFEQEDGSLPIISDHIYVLTPNGDIVELPEGATPLDFAFQIHTDVGLSFRSARVNGSIAPLTYELENGDVVEVMRNRTPQPSPEWLKLVKMASSKSRLKRYLHSLHRTEYVLNGRNTLNEELHRHHLALLDGDYSVMRLCDGQELSMQEREDLLMKIGQGTEKAALILGRLDILHSMLSHRQFKQAVPPKAVMGLIVDGGLPMPIRFAKCCKPQDKQTDSIVGIIARNGYIMIHDQECRMIRQANVARKIGVRWEDESTGVRKKRE